MASTSSSKPDESGQNPLENATVDPCNNLDRKQYFQFDSVAHAAAAGQRSRYAESLTMSKNMEPFVAEYFSNSHESGLVGMLVNSIA